MDSAKLVILGIRQRDVSCVDAKVLAPKIMNVTVRLANANARKITTVIYVTSVRYVE